MISKFVISGAPGSGKTSTLNFLQDAGYSIVEESARRILKSIDDKTLVPRALAKRFIEEDEARYLSSSVAEHPVLFDRGILDSLCFAVSTGFLPEMEAIARSALFPFSNPIFLFPPWEDIYQNDSQRTQSFDEAVIVFERLHNWFHRIGYTTFICPRASVEQRRDVIVSEISRVIGDNVSH